MSKGTERPSWPGVDGEPSSPLAQALTVAREDDVNAAQVARLAAALAPIYGAAIASSAHAASSASAASVGQAGTAAGASASATAGASAAASVKIATAVLATVALGTVGLMALGAPAARPRPDAAKPPVAAEVSTLDAAPPQALPVVEPTMPDDQTAARATSEAANDQAAALQAEARAARVQRAPAQRPEANAPVEAQLLTEAHAALTSDATRALRLADEHRARFPRGALAAERELLAVRALEQQGRAAEARRRIARARRELPRSAPVQRAAERLGTLP